MRRAPEVGLPPAGSKTLAHLSLQEPFASRPEICFTLSSAKTLAHLHGRPRSTYSRSRTVGFPFPVLQRIFGPQHPAPPLSKKHRTSQHESASHFRTSGLL